ncbi:MAG: hypothetical protein R3C03_16325 [Pirellulaceae bacterium]
MVGKIGALSSTEPLAGTVRLLSGNVLPASTNVGISNGYLDIGNNNVTIANLVFTNQNQSRAWDTVRNANNGVIGSGTLRVTGEINVLGQTGLNPGNSIAANVDLGGGTQIVRVGAISSFGLNNSLMFTGTLSNGSLKKSIGTTVAGTIGSIDGMSLFGNNTYTGDTILNSGMTVVTGTNQSQSLTEAGIGGPGFSVVSLQGANGSYLSATNIRAFGNGSFRIDNNAAVGASGNNSPNVAAAQNNNRIRDDVAIELRDGNFTYRGFAGAAATETFGSLNASGGHNSITITPNGGGTVVLTGTGGLTLGPRATLNISAYGNRQYAWVTGEVVVQRNRARRRLDGNHSTRCQQLGLPGIQRDYWFSSLHSLRLRFFDSEHQRFIGSVNFNQFANNQRPENHGNSDNDYQ